MSKELIPAIVLLVVIGATMYFTRQYTLNQIEAQKPDTVIVQNDKPLPDTIRITKYINIPAKSRIDTIYLGSSIEDSQVVKVSSIDTLLNVLDDSGKVIGKDSLAVAYLHTPLDMFDISFRRANITEEKIMIYVPKIVQEDYPLTHKIGWLTAGIGIGSIVTLILTK